MWRQPRVCLCTRRMQFASEKMRKIFSLWCHPAPRDNLLYLIFSLHKIEHIVPPSECLPCPGVTLAWDAIMQLAVRRHLLLLFFSFDTPTNCLRESCFSAWQRQLNIFALRLLWNMMFALCYCCIFHLWLNCALANGNQLKIAVKEIKSFVTEI